MRNNWFSREGLTAALPPNVEAGRMAGIIRSTLLGAASSLPAAMAAPIRA